MYIMFTLSTFVMFINLKTFYVKDIYQTLENEEKFWYINLIRNVAWTMQQTNGRLDGFEIDWFEKKTQKPLLIAFLYQPDVTETCQFQNLKISWASNFSSCSNSNNSTTTSYLVISFFDTHMVKKYLFRKFIIYLI